MTDDAKKTNAPGTEAAEDSCRVKRFDSSCSHSESEEKNKTAQGEQEQIQELIQRIGKLEDMLSSTIKQVQKLRRKQSKWSDQQYEQIYTRMAGKPTTFLLGVGCTLILVPLGVFVFFLIWTFLIAAGDFLGFTKNMILAGIVCVLIGTVILLFASPLAKSLVKLFYELDDESELEYDI